jgi:hypothetical protein
MNSAARWPPDYQFWNQVVKVAGHYDPPLVSNPMGKSARTEKIGRNRAARNDQRIVLNGSAKVAGAPTNRSPVSGSYA